MNQSELSFESPAPQHGYDGWRAERREAKRALACRLGLPLGHQVEVWLRGEVRLRGRLELAEEKLFVPEGNDPHLRLAIGAVSFEAGEIESCVRQD
jgi:hypothetical protein